MIDDGERKQALLAAAAAMCFWCKQGNTPIMEDGWLMHYLPERKQTYEACNARPIHDLIKG